VFSPPRIQQARLPVSAFPASDRALVTRVHCCFVQAQPKRTTAMDNFIGFAEVAGAIIAALGLALGLEWVGLYGLTSLMPIRRNHPRDTQS
jgi:hypothetical protein